MQSVSKKQRKVFQKETIQACRLRKHRMYGCRAPKQSFIVMACDSKSHAIVLWCVISVKLDIGTKVTGLEIMVLNREKI